MTIGNSDQTQVGQPVIAIGSPLGLPGTVTQGIVSAVNRPLVVGQSNDADNPTAYINGIQTDAPINPGNSGGPDGGRRGAGDRGQLGHLDHGLRARARPATSASGSPSRSTRPG